MILTDFYLFSEAPQTRSKQIVAKLETAHNSVKRRPSSVPLWQEIDGNQDLYHKDQVFTGASSQAQIFLPHMNARIQVGENSLVVIDTQQDVESAGWLSGIFGERAAQEQKAKQVAIAINGAKAKISQDAIIEVKKNDKGETQLAVIQGELTIEKPDGAETSIQQNQATRVTLEGAIEAPVAIHIRLVSPDDRARSLIAGNASASTQFRWEQESYMKNVELQIATEPSFENPRRIIPSVGGSAAANSESGFYYWRISGYDERRKETFVSESRSFHIVAPEIPAALAPAHGEKIIVDLSGRAPEEQNISHNVLLDWMQPESVSSYEVELAESEDFSKPLTRRSAAHPPLEISVAKETSYYWRVRARYSEQVASSWSSPSKFEISYLRPRIEVTGLVSDPAQLTLASDPKEKIMTQLSWDEINAMSHYVVEVSKSAEFSDSSIEKFRTKQAHYEWSPSTEGIYYWRVRPIPSHGSAIDPSSARMIEILPAPKVAEPVVVADELPPALAPEVIVPEPVVEPVTEIIPPPAKLAVIEPKLLPPPELRSKHREVIRIVYANRLPKYELTWREVEGAKQYEVRVTPLGSNPSGLSFKEVWQKTDTQNFSFQPVEGEAVFAARSIDMNENAGPWGELARIEVTQDAEILKPLAPAAGAFAETAGSGLSMQFTWKDAGAGSRYLFELSRDESFQRVTHYEETSDPQLNVTIKNPGTYYWRVTGSSHQYAALYGGHANFEIKKVAPPLEAQVMNSWLVSLWQGASFFNFQKQGSVNDYEASELSTDTLVALSYRLSEAWGVAAKLAYKQYTFFKDEAGRDTSGQQKEERATEFMMQLGSSYQMQFLRGARLRAQLYGGYGEIHNVISPDRSRLQLDRIKLYTAGVETQLTLFEQSRHHLDLGLDVAPWGSSPDKNVSEYSAWSALVGYNYRPQWWRLLVIGPAMQSRLQEMRISESNNSESDHVKREEYLMYLRAGLEF